MNTFHLILATNLKTVRRGIAVGLAVLFLGILLCATATRPSATPLQALDGGPMPGERGQSAEPVVMFGTHHGGLWALRPETQADGDVEFNWAWDSTGIRADARSGTIMPYPDGTHDYYAVGGGGGVVRMQAGDDVAQWIGPGITGMTNWMGYGTGPIGIGAVDIDRVHGDVFCASLAYVGPPALGQAGVYCSYTTAVETPNLQPIDPADRDLVGRLVVIPRPDGFTPEQTAVVLGADDKAWRYVWNDQESQMEWRGPETLPVPNPGHDVVSAQVYPHPDDGNRFTVFLATADIDCLAGSVTASDCSNGVIVYRDFDRRGQPVGEPWRELPHESIAEECDIESNLVWVSNTASARWLASWPEPAQEAIFFAGGAWNAAALGLYSATCLLRVEPGETPDDPYEFTGFADDTLGDNYQLRLVTMAPAPEADGGWRLYVLALKTPSESEYERMLVDFEILYSDHYGDEALAFTKLAEFENKGPYTFATNLAVAPGWSADGSGAYGLYLGAEAVLSTPGGFERELLPGAYGGNSTMFGSGVTAAGLQVTGLHVRDGNAGEWRSSLDMAPHAVAVGREHVYFSSWPFSRAPGMMTDGGGLYEVDPVEILTHAALGDGSMPDLKKVWDPATHQCQLVVPTDPSLNPPPVAHYVAVDPGEEQVFAIMRTAGAGYDFWPHGEGCGDGLWVAHRPATAGQPWTWELLLEEDDGPIFRHLWVIADAGGNFQELIVGLAENTDDYPNLRAQFPQPFLRLFHDGAVWQYEEIDVGLPLRVDPTTCQGAGFAYDPVETDQWIATVACGDQVGEPDGPHSYIRQSDDGGSSFSHWGEGNYDGLSLGATVLYRYPNGERRLFVLASGEGVMVQADTQDPFSLTLVQQGLGRLSTTTGASTLNLMWPPPSPLTTSVYLPLVMHNH